MNEHEPISAPGNAAALSREQAETLLLALSQLPWGADGLTRQQIKRRYPDLPEVIFLRLPASKHYTSAEQVMHDADLSQSRAEGEYLGANPDMPEQDSVSDGGPAGWGGDPLYSIRGVEQSGSTTDTEGLESGS